MEQVLIKENKYNGSYVAIKDFGDSTVIADGKDPKEAYDKEFGGRVNSLKRGYVPKFP